METERSGPERLHYETQREWWDVTPELKRGQHAQKVALRPPKTAKKKWYQRDSNLHMFVSLDSLGPTHYTSHD